MIKGFPKGAAHAPKFPKQKDEGWWLVLGDADDGQLLALRRVSFLSILFLFFLLLFPFLSPFFLNERRDNHQMAYMGKTTSTSLTFDAPTEEGPKELQVYLLSDSYLGLDQQYSVKFNVV